VPFGGWLIHGDVVWRRPPKAEYLEALGDLPAQSISSALGRTRILETQALSWAYFARGPRPVPKGRHDLWVWRKMREHGWSGGDGERRAGGDGSVLLNAPGDLGSWLVNHRAPSPIATEVGGGAVGGRTNEAMACVVGSHHRGRGAVAGQAAHPRGAAAGGGDNTELHPGVEGAVAVIPTDDGGTAVGVAGDPAAGLHRMGCALAPLATVDGAGAVLVGDLAEGIAAHATALERAVGAAGAAQHATPALVDDARASLWRENAAPIGAAGHALRALNVARRSALRSALDQHGCAAPPEDAGVALGAAFDGRITAEARLVVAASTRLLAHPEEALVIWCPGGVAVRPMSVTLGRRSGFAITSLPSIATEGCACSAAAEGAANEDGSHDREVLQQRGVVGHRSMRLV
jgi:hypothetical protein